MAMKKSDVEPKVVEKDEDPLAKYRVGPNESIPDPKAANAIPADLSRDKDTNG